MLFLLFVDDLPNTVQTSRVACYADDTKIFKSIDSITDCSALQSDLKSKCTEISRKGWPRPKFNEPLFRV